MVLLAAFAIRRGKKFASKYSVLEGVFGVKAPPQHGYISVASFLSPLLIFDVFPFRTCELQLKCVPENQLNVQLSAQQFVTEAKSSHSEFSEPDDTKN